MRYRFALLLLVFLLPTAVGAGDSSERPANGPRRVDPGWHALVGATVHVTPDRVVEAATVLVRDGRIVRVSKEPPPAGARAWDLAGHHVYAAFLDAHVAVDAPRPPKDSPGDHWNPVVTPARSALDGEGIDGDTAKELRELGFGAAAIVPGDGVARGSAALVSLAEREPEAVSAPVYRKHVWNVLGFDNATKEQGGYPNALMGAIAVIRQALSDGIVPDDAPLIFDARDELTVLRAAKIGAEFGRTTVVLGSGTEFRRLAAIERGGVDLVLPLAFPKKPKLDSIGAIESTDLRTMMTWEQAPTNPGRLDAAGVRVALTTHRLEKRDKFREKLRKAIRHGLAGERALAMLTTTPAALLGVADDLGTVEAGRRANLQVTDGPVFDEHTRLRWLFVDGKPHEIRPAALTGTWKLTLAPAIPEETTLVFDPGDELWIHQGDAKQKAKADVSGDLVSFTFDHEPFGDPGTFVLSGERSGETIEGSGRRSDGRSFRWTAERISRDYEEDAKEEEQAPDVPDLPGYPFGPYALEGPPQQPDVVIVRGGTIWTCGPQGVIENGVVVVRKGKIVYVGDSDGAAPHITREGDRVRETIDARNTHVTPGIIDAHSHTGISGGVNDSGQAVTAEVRIQDVTNPDDVNWYRQLAGGVTAVLSLHGSANPIGGQSQTVRLRWGAYHPDDMHFEGAAPGIKFALGENVKQSNWGDDQTTRYPQTRMGVETLIRDRFIAAREYAAAENPPRDLELEALAEILAGKRLLHCHSYRQDEILMLCRVAKEFGFRIGTFTHVLEGYKVAEAIREQSIGASCFSDWWAYKVEVQDAIPENGAIMHEVGVLVTFNSDSSELARRLNLEAAKAVKYGGVAPEEALKFVTLNAAKQLKIDDRVGSLEVGKDADFAIWNGHPLSTATRCLQTWIDGRTYFSLARDHEHRERIAAERKRLIAKILAAKDEDGKDWEEEEEEDYRCCEDGGVR